jgi:CheY-like chemotaxis protein
MSTVLFVDDETAITDQFAQTIAFDARRRGVIPVTLVAKSDGSGALAYIDRLEEPLDCVVTDYRLGPTFSGLDVIRHLRASRRDKYVPCFMVTGQAGKTDEVAAEATEFGIVRYVRKPFSAMALLEAVNSAVELFHARRAVDQFHQTILSIAASIHSAMEIGSPRRVEDLAQAAAIALQLVGRAKTAVVFLRNSGRSCLTLAATSGGSQASIPPEIQMGAGVIGKVALSRQKTSVSTPPPIPSPHAFETGAKSLLYVPLCSNDTLVGLVGLVDADERDWARESDAELVALADLLALSFADNARGTSMDRILVSALRSAIEATTKTTRSLPTAPGELAEIQKFAAAAAADPLDKQRLEVASLVQSLSHRSSEGLAAATQILAAVDRLVAGLSEF